MRPGYGARRAGFALLPVVLALVLLAATAYLMTRESASGLARVASARQTDRARYVAEAALRHATWQVQSSSCSGFSDVPSTAFGADHYSATVTPTSGSPITVTATGSLADGTSHTIERTGIAAYQPASTQVLQLGTDPGKDVLIDSFWPTRNSGGTSYLRVSADPSWTTRSLLQFDLSSLPSGATILSARLELRMWSLGAAGSATAHAVTRDWVEGTKNGGGTADGATWLTHNATSSWSTAGGDFAAQPIAEASIQPGDTWVAWELRSLVQQWVDGLPNHGLLLAGAWGLQNAEFASREENSPANRPKLTITYACECGGCAGGGPGGGGTRVLYVVQDPGVLSSQESARRTLMQGWGFAVTLIDDDATQAAFDTAADLNDAAYVSQEAVATTLASKLNGALIGVVNESKDMIDDFGFATGLSMGGGLPTLNVDPTHYITSVFATNPIAPYVANEWYQRAAEPVAAGVDPVGAWVEAPWTGKPALMALTPGAALSGGGAAAGRRVQIPWGSGQGATPVALDSLSDDARTIIKRSIEWAGGIGCGSSKSLGMVVSDASNPNSEEMARKTLLESWCYHVTLITASEPAGVYNDFPNNYDVVYVAGTVNYADVVNKLKLVPIGVVNESRVLSFYLGFTSGTGGYTSTTIEIVEDTHPITTGFAIGNLTVASTAISLGRFTNTIAPGLLTLANRPATADRTMMTLDTGDEMASGGNAPDRRVMLPWGASIGALNDTGLTILRRSLEWAGGGPSDVVFQEFTDASLANNAGTSLIIARPGGTAAGDLLIAAVATAGDHASTLSAPAGWTVVGVGSEANQSPTLGVWWKLAGASEPADYTFAWSGGEQAYGFVMRFTGHDPVNPVDVSAVVSADSASSSPPSPAVVTTVSDTMILRIGGFDDDDITAGNPGLAGHTAITMGESGNGGSSASAGAGYLGQAAAGDSGTSTFSLTASREYVTLTLAIAPAP